MKEGQSRNWVFTLHDYTDEQVNGLSDRVTSGALRYCGFAKEVGKTNRPHRQGCLYRVRKKRRLGVKERLGPIYNKIHRERIRGTWEEAVGYWKTPDRYDKDTPVGIYEYGHPPKNRPITGNTELDYKLIANVIGTPDFEGRRETHPQAWLSYYKLNDYIGAKNGARGDKHIIINIWINGKSGVYKSTLARRVGEVFGHGKDDYYVKTMGSKWFCGYDGEAVVVMDDLSLITGAGVIDTFYLLKVRGDHYPVRVEIKGSSKTIRPAVVIVTSNLDMDKWMSQQVGYDSYIETAVRDALKRRYAALTLPVKGYEKVNVRRLSNEELKVMIIKGIKAGKSEAGATIREVLEASVDDRGKK